MRLPNKANYDRVSAAGKYDWDWIEAAAIFFGLDNTGKCDFITCAKEFGRVVIALAGWRQRGFAMSACRILASIALLAACISAAFAQAQTVNRTARGKPNTDIRVGVYLHVRPDCTPGPLPSIQLTSPPKNGKVTVKAATIKVTNFKQCLALEVPAFVATYRSQANFVGVDALTLEIKFPGGKTEVQQISVTVGDGSPGQRT